MNDKSLNKYPIYDHQDSLRIAQRFSRKCPMTPEYIERLASELKVIIGKGFVDHLLKVTEIIEMTKDIPHITRGSAGSSLVCYLLGITNINPVEKKIMFERFLNAFKDSSDIDLDFPTNKRDIVFKRIFEKWDGKVARISNHVTYGEKGALRKAIKEMGYKKKVPKNKCNIDFFGKDRRDELVDKKNQYVGKMKCYSLHVGGIIFFEDGVPEKYVLKDNQVNLNKDDIDRLKYYKVDILSNRGLAQLFDISKTPIEDYPSTDQKTITLLQSAKNLGLTFAESPAMKKIFHIIKPKSVDDLAICLALVRPMAADNKSKFSEVDYEEGMIIFDDDAINYIKSTLNCTNDLADRYRRSFSKMKWKDINYFNAITKEFSNQKEINGKLTKLRKYSFCKSHAYSYAYLVWALAYQKANNTKQFWIATLNNCHSYYRRWVHPREAIADGIDLPLGYGPWKLYDNRVVSVNKKKKADKEITDKLAQYKTYGYWTGKEFLDNMYVQFIKKGGNLVKFRGLIAAGRWHRKWSGGKYKYSTFVTIGYQTGHFVDLILDRWQSVKGYDAISGQARIMSNQRDSYIHLNVMEYQLERL